mmetsp:Transcript_18847/g.32188  ORF Transcript_18847/g.32188 Transcript_18847/m.32188 type:complete len:178 (-) Transcript_18847:710-1243(-)
MAPASKSVLVTVGSTKFDELIRAVDTERCVAALKAKGFTHVFVQKGNGAYSPSQWLAAAGHDTGMTVECFDYRPSLSELIATVDLVISHAGSGSIFEALSTGRPLLVVPNEKLMDNHQVELAEQLAGMGHLVCARSSELVSVLESVDFSKLKPYVPGSPAKVAAHISVAVGMTTASA